MEPPPRPTIERNNNKDICNDGGCVGLMSGYSGQDLKWLTFILNGTLCDWNSFPSIPNGFLSTNLLFNPDDKHLYLCNHHQGD